MLKKLVKCVFVVIVIILIAFLGTGRRETLLHGAKNFKIFVEKAFGQVVKCIDSSDSKSTVTSTSEELIQELSKDREKLEGILTKLNTSLQLLHEKSNSYHERIPLGKKIADQLCEAMMKKTYPATVNGKTYSSKNSISLQLEMTLAEMDNMKTSLTEIDRM